MDTNASIMQSKNFGRIEIGNTMQNSASIYGSFPPPMLLIKDPKPSFRPRLPKLRRCNLLWALGRCFAKCNSVTAHRLQGYTILPEPF